MDGKAWTQKRPLPDWMAENMEEIEALPAIKAERRLCLVKACVRDATRRGMCHMHFSIARHKFDPEMKDRDRKRRRLNTARKRREFEQEVRPDWPVRWPEFWEVALRLEKDQYKEGARDPDLVSDQERADIEALLARAAKVTRGYSFDRGRRAAEDDGPDSG